MIGEPTTVAQPAVVTQSAVVAEPVTQVKPAQQKHGSHELVYETLHLPWTWTPARIVLSLLVVAGLVASAWRYFFGMGSMSNMSNEVPWGIWISVDLLCGVATAAGAFTVAATVYMFRLEDFRPLVKPAVLTGFLGYAAVVFALLVDLARPERIWHMVIYWNPESPLFEVGLCVMTYLGVLALEFIPTLFEGLKWDKAVHIMHKITIFLVIFGTLLSTLHQSSLGSLLLPIGKIHPLWWTPIQPVLFFLSAAAVGLAMTVLESSISSHSYGRGLELNILSRLVRGIPWILGIYLALRIGDLVISGDWHYLFTRGLAPTLYWIELLVGFVTPVVIFSIRKLRTNARWLQFGSGLYVAGLCFNRLNIGLINWTRPEGVHYLPALGELAVTLGVLSAAILVYDWVARRLPLFMPEHGKH
ncbi:MAG: NrfD/PsrC family molybdoenzyme membrane anchor subunit [Mycobacterium leprae]